MNFEILIFPTTQGRVTRNTLTTFKVPTYAKRLLPLKRKIKCRSETSYRFNCRLSSPTAAPSARCSDLCRNMLQGRRTRKRRTCAVALWRPSRSAAQRYEPVSATAITHCADHATTVGTHGCNCQGASSASPPRPTTTAAYLTNVLYNFKSNFTNESKDSKTIRSRIATHD